MKFQQFMDRSHLMKFHLQYQLAIPPLIQSLKKLDLNLNEALCLAALFFENGGETSPGDLGQTLRIPKDQISHALNTLENKGLIQRQLSPKDKRKRILSMTAIGKKHSSELVKVFDRHEDHAESIYIDKN